MNVLLTRTPVKILPVISCFEQIEVSSRRDEKKTSLRNGGGSQYEIQQKKWTRSVKGKPAMECEKYKVSGNDNSSVTVLELKTNTSIGFPKTEYIAPAEYLKFKEKTVLPHLPDHDLKPPSSIDDDVNNIIGNADQLDASTSQNDNVFHPNLTTETVSHAPENQDVISSTSQNEASPKDHTYFINQLLSKEKEGIYGSDTALDGSSGILEINSIEYINKIVGGENKDSPDHMLSIDNINAHHQHHNQHDHHHHDPHQHEEDAMMNDYLNEHIVGDDECSTNNEKGELDRQSCASEEIPSPPFEKVATSSEDPHLGQTKDISDDPQQLSQFSGYNIDPKVYDTNMVNPSMSDGFNEVVDDDEKSLFSDCEDFDVIHINIDGYGGGSVGLGGKETELTMNHQNQMSCDVTTTSTLAMSSKPSKKSTKPRQKREKKKKSTSIVEVTETVVSSTTLHNNGLTMNLGQPEMFAGTNHSCFSVDQRYVEQNNDQPLKRKRGRPLGSKNKKKDPQKYVDTPMYNFNSPNRNGFVQIYNKKVCNRRPYYNTDVVSPQHPSSTFSPQNYLTYSPPQQPQQPDIFQQFLNATTTSAQLISNQMVAVNQHQPLRGYQSNTVTAASPSFMTTSAFNTPNVRSLSQESDEMPLINFKRSLPPQLFAPTNMNVLPQMQSFGNALCGGSFTYNKSTKKVTVRTDSESPPFSLEAQFGENNLIDKAKTYSNNSVVKTVFVPPEVETLIIDQEGGAIACCSNSIKEGGINQPRNHSNVYGYANDGHQVMSPENTPSSDRVSVTVNR